MEKLTFKQLTRDTLYFRLGLKQHRKHILLDQWLDLSKEQTVDEFEEKQLTRLQNTLLLRASSWNEFELSEWFIGPLLSMIEFNSEEISMFAFREITAVVNDIELTGRPDVMIAKGIDDPQVPYFCFHEYKRQTDPDGNPQTQLLGAMLAAQTLNNNQKPICGIYVIGYDWVFVVLNGSEWCESNPYTATDDDELFDIYKILKVLKKIILKNTETPKL